MSYLYGMQDSDSENDAISDLSDDDTTVSNTSQRPVLSVTLTEPNWGLINDNVSCRIFSLEIETYGINPDLFDSLIDGTPYDFFSLFVDNEILNVLVKETNIYMAIIYVHVPYVQSLDYKNGLKSILRK